MIDGHLACCGEPVEETPRKAKHMSEPVFQRKGPSVAGRKSILAKQGNCCLYCERPFGSSVFYKGKPRKVVLVWDHLVPFAYAADNKDSNFVAACSLCNGFKSDKVFQTLEEARVYVYQMWSERCN